MNNQFGSNMNQDSNTNSNPSMNQGSNVDQSSNINQGSNLNMGMNMNQNVDSNYQQFNFGQQSNPQQVQTSYGGGMSSGGKKNKLNLVEILLLVIILCGLVVGLLQATGVVDVVSVFKGGSSQISNSDDIKSDDKVEDKKELGNEEKLANLCSTYASKVNDNTVYYNGKLIPRAEFDEMTDDVTDYEVCDYDDTGVVCMTSNNENVSFYQCSTKRYEEISLNEVIANLILNQSCATVDIDGNFHTSYSDLPGPGEEGYISCTNFQCMTIYNGKEYSKTCDNESSS